MTANAPSFPTRETRKPTILVIDDSPMNLETIGEVLAHHYTVKVATSGRRGLELAQTLLPDLILLDIMMPGLTGYQVLQELQQQPATRDIPTIFITSLDSTHDEAAGLDLGVVDYLTKPVRPAIALSRIRNHLELAAARERLRDANTVLETRLRRQGREEAAAGAAVEAALRALARTWGGIDEARATRVSALTRLIASELGTEPGELDRLARAATLVDVGMARVPAAVTATPGPLDPAGRAAIHAHPVAGEELLLSVARDAGNADVAEVLHAAAVLSRHHQERWDGSGYPAGLAGDAIPLQARIVGACDALVAMLAARADRAALPFDEAMATLQAARGAGFDPRVVDALTRRRDDVRDLLAAPAG